MTKKRIYYPRTTASQRKKLFEVWEENKDVGAACREARVSERTFYNWKPRFEAGGYEALEKFERAGPTPGSRKSHKVQHKVIELKKAHPKWGRRRIADEIAKENNWVPLVSASSVKRILEQAGLWPEPQAAKKKSRFEAVNRTAEEPGQTLNVDLCFVPASHEVAVKLPAVSGSSGRLIVERPKAEPVEPAYPGLVFAADSLPYNEAMEQFVKASQAKDKPLPPAEMGSAEVEKGSLKVKKQRLRRKKEALRLSRRHSREQRQAEDVVWQALKSQRRTQQTDRKAHLKSGPKPTWGSKKAQAEHWRCLRQQRQAQLKQRDQQDLQWRQDRCLLREQTLELPLVTHWLAILVVTDNCTRQCLGLPLFVAGNQVTADMVVEALRCLLPPQLQFLISDRGPQFIAQLFQQLAKDEQFIHVLIARHRPQSNGIAERFVRTLKEWLADKPWQSEHELGQLLTQFLAHYNHRPHQGLPIPGLSPHEFAKRIWLF